MVWTNDGKKKMFETWFEGSGAPANFTLMAATSDTGTFDADLSSTSQITLLASGNGYDQSGLLVDRNGVDFTVSANLASDYARATLAAGYQWSATGGNIPPTGNGIAYILLAGPDVDVNIRTIYAFWATASELTVTENNTLSITTASLQGT